jgi:dTDP-4-amino-4,6-dideoxygalactose transaminase
VRRKQLPVYSPVSAGSLAAGALALLGDGARARARVAELVRAEYAPRDVTLTGSGTTALTLALLAVRRRAERAGRAPVVALPAYACFDLATAAVGADVRVTFYDLDPRTLGPSWDSLARVLADEPAAVVVAHLYGVPVDARRVRALAAEAGAVVIDDAAQGVGATLGGRPLGVEGALGVLSFGRGKGRTGGGGGALLANDAEGAELLGLVRHEVPAAARGVGPWAKLTAQWLLGRPSLYWIPAGIPALGLGETPYHPPGGVTGMPATVAAALEANWRESASEAAERRRLADRWRADARLASWHLPVSEAADAVPGWLRLPVLVPPGERGIEAAAALGGGAMPAYPRSLPTLEPLARRALRTESWSGADDLVSRLLTLPCHRHVRFY